MPKKISKQKSINRAKTFTELVICAIILGGAGVAGKSLYDSAHDVPQTQNDPLTIDDTDTTEPSDSNEANLSSIPVPTVSKFTGPLILVNNEYEYYSTGDEDLVSIMSMNDDTGRNTFTAVDYNYTILREVYEPLAQMVDDWYKLYSNDTLIVYGSYRSKEFQQQLYDQFISDGEDDDEFPLVAKPGFSEHETGYAFDFSETTSYDYEGTDDFSWLNENCYKYGFIIRYEEDKENITKYRYEPWHFRYVGIPHAEYMTKNNLCLEEYIELLRNAYSYDNKHLMITTESGKEYEVYFVPSNDADEYTGIPVPSNLKYDISGNNVDGFIVTVHNDEPAGSDAEPVPETTPDTTDEIAEETTELEETTE